MDFSWLPAEMIEEVTGYLSLDDLKACSMVSKQWRTAFDNDRLWKKYLTFHPNYFNKQVTKLRRSSEYFVRGCQSKRQLFQELKVRKNLLEGRYDLARVDIGRFYCDNLVDVIDDIGNHWLFVSCAENHFFENSHLIKVWNMKDKSIIHHQTKETPLGVTGRLIGSEMRAVKNKLYYFLKNILIAFDFSPPEYELTILFVVGCPDFDFIRRPGCETAMVCKPNMVLGYVYTHEHASLSADPWVHVWGDDASLLYKNYSIKEVDQMKEVQIDYNRYCYPPILEIKDGGSSDSVLLVCRLGNYKFSVVVFNTNTFQFTLLFIQEKVKFIYCDLVKELVVVSYSNSYEDELGEDSNIIGQTVICYSTNGYLLYQMKRLPFGSIYHIVTANEGKEILVVNASGKATVHDVLKRKAISRFKIPSGVIGVAFIKENIIIVQLQKKKNIAHEVWDFKSGKRLYGFDELQFFSHEPGFYKLVFTKDYSSPPKIFAIKEPSHYYCKPCHGEIVMISFF